MTTSTTKIAKKANLSNKSLKTQQDRSVYIPEDILEYIFSFLPIKDAIKIGTLSTRFKKSWLFSRTLNFDKVFARDRGKIDFISIVNKVLDSHSGPKIESFSLYFDPYHNGEDLVENWIQKAIDKGVEELHLNLYPAILTNTTPYFFSNDYFDFESLRVLKLTHCDTYFLPEFKNLSFLKTVVLRYVCVNDYFIETLCSNCLLLETLDCAYCEGAFFVFAKDLKRFKVLKIGECGLGSSTIRIDAPTLRSFHYSGFSCRFEFFDISQLNDVLLNIRHKLSSNSVTIANKIPHVQVFSTSGSFLQGLRPGGSCGFQNLKEFQVFFHPSSDHMDIVNFVRNCPSLEKLLIQLDDKIWVDRESNWKIDLRKLLDECNPAFPSLKFIKLSGFRFQENEILLVRSFLQKAINLEKLILVTPIVQAQGKIEIYEKYLLSCKVSLRAEIQFIEQDTSDLQPLHCNTYWFDIDSM